MPPKRCAACGKQFRSRPQTPNQTYCSAPDCQRKRRQQWQRQKMEIDPDYRENQARAQRSWLDRNPDYWREYRKARPEYSARNRELQKKRDSRRSDTPLAKMDVSMPAPALPEGIYHLRPIVVPDLAKMDAWTVEITLLPESYAELGPIAKR